TRSDRDWSSDVCSSDLEALTGGPPLRACTPAEMIRRLAEDEPVPPSRLRAGVPADLSAVCLKCLEKNPKSRYPSAAALAEDLRQIGRASCRERGWIAGV